MLELPAKQSVYESGFGSRPMPSATNPTKELILLSCFKNAKGRWTFDGAEKDWKSELEARKALAAYRAKKRNLVRGLSNGKD